MDTKNFIAFIDGNECSTEETRSAETTSHELTKKGLVLIRKGVGDVTETACKGSSVEGDVATSLLHSDNRQTANRHVQIPIVIDMDGTRNMVIVKSTQVFISIGGDYGTLSELGHALRSSVQASNMTKYLVLVYA